MSTLSPRKILHNTWSFLRRYYRWLIGTVVLGLLLLFLAVIVVAKNLPSVAEFGSRQVDQSTKIYDRTGKVLLYEISAGRTEGSADRRCCTT